MSYVGRSARNVECFKGAPPPLPGIPGIACVTFFYLVFCIGFRNAFLSTFWSNLEEHVAKMDPQGPQRLQKALQNGAKMDARHDFFVKRRNTDFEQHSYGFA